EQEFETYFSTDLAEVTQSPEEIATTLQQLSAQTNTKPAVLWAIPREDSLHLVLITPSGEPIVRDLYDVPEEVLRQTVNDFHLEMYDSPENMRAAQKLYSWMIEPFESDYLQAEEIDTLLFCLGNGLRSLPLAALYDGEKFLIEHYALTQIPAFNLIQTEYSSLAEGRFLAMGASQFQSLNPLPAVPTELTNALRAWQLDPPVDSLRVGQLFLNPEFTLANLKQQIDTHSPEVVHLATHALFRAGEPENSYIQLWDSQLTLDHIQAVNWRDPAVELLVLSACQTAIGNDSAELGFAGLTLRSGVKSVVASIWNISDTGTLALMSEFYEQLGRTSTKAEALRQAQLKMIRGEVAIEGDQLQLSRGNVDLSGELSREEISDLSSPYYWAAFTMVGSPW
ncbi:MAG: CHAT domain-containing protein, partial [Phormidesmis sp.]